MTVSVHALADGHVSMVIAACANWEELAQYGPPYWRPRSPAELHRKIAATAGPQPAAEYSFVLEADGRLKGECSLHAIDWRNSLAQIGVCIWSQGDRRRGFGRAAVNHVIDWGFGYLGLARLEAWVVDGNEPSLGLFRQSGFADEATLQGRYLHGGVRKAVHVLSLSVPT